MSQYIEILSIEQSASNKLRLKFSQPVPYLTPTTGLQTKNYTVLAVLGDVEQPIVKVSTIEDHYDSVDIELESNLIPDAEYRVRVTNLVNQAGKKLKYLSDSQQYVVVPIEQEPPLTAIYMPPATSGLKQMTTEASLRRYMSPILDGPNFRALLAGFATGEVANQRNAELAKDQLFFSTASGEYLDRAASDFGVTRPNVGMRDATFREYVESFYNFKVTEDALYRMLRVFYGIDGVQAYVENNGPPPSPIPVDDGDTLTLKFDGNKTVTMTFFRDEFASYTIPTQVEAAILISRKIQEQKVGGFAIVVPLIPAIIDPPTPEVPPKLRIYSATMGLRSSVEVVGGSALDWLNLEVQTKHLRSRLNVSYIGRDNTDTMRIFLHAISDAVRQSLSNASYLGVNGWTFDPANRFAITGTETTLSQNLFAGSSYSEISVANVSGFSDDSGYIAIGFGYDYEQGPIKYTRRNTNTNTLILEGFRPTQDITAVSIPPAPPAEPVYVTLLNGNQGYQRANLSQTFGTPAGIPGSMYATNSNVARIACAVALLDIIEAGSKHKIQVVYPSGYGLLGSVLEKNLVVSDLVRIYGPNDVTY